MQKIYTTKDKKKEVEVIEETEDGFVKFNSDGIELTVAKNRFLKIYVPKHENVLE